MQIYFVFLSHRLNLNSVPNSTNETSPNSTNERINRPVYGITFPFSILWDINGKQNKLKTANQEILFSVPYTTQISCAQLFDHFVIFKYYMHFSFEIKYIQGSSVIAAFGDAIGNDWRSTGTCTIQVD